MFQVIMYKCVYVQLICMLKFVFVCQIVFVTISIKHSHILYWLITILRCVTKHSYTNLFLYIKLHLHLLKTIEDILYDSNYVIRYINHLLTIMDVASKKCPICLQLQLKRH